MEQVAPHTPNPLSPPCLRHALQRLDTLIAELDEPVAARWQQAISDILAATTATHESHGHEANRTIHTMELAHWNATTHAAASMEKLQSSVTELRSELHSLRVQLRDSESENEKILAAQANAIVKSAEMIADLQETKLAAERLSHLGKILDNSGNEIYVADCESLHFIHVNYGARENLGYTLDELRRMTPADFIPNFEQTTAKQLASLRDTQSPGVRFTSAHQRKDGSLYPIDVHLHRAIFEDRPVYVAVIHDISERVQLEADLRASTEAAIAADQAKSEFLANMSHEIRTPMTAMLGFCDLLQGADMSERERTEAVQIIQRNGHHLLDLINDILDLSKVEAGKLSVERQRTIPAEILRDVQDLMFERARLKNNEFSIRIESKMPPTIQTDPLRLKQALVNIVGNAIKFTEQGSVQVCVSCDFVQEQLCFRISDTGIGISPDQISRLFRPFVQADTSMTRRFGGTGLGLTISKRIAELLGGDIQVESQLGKGSTFTLTVKTGPLDDTPDDCCPSSSAVADSTTVSQSTPSAASDQQNHRKLHGNILLVEDGADNQRLIGFLLKQAGARVTVAENGQEGLQLTLQAHASGSPFDVVLMDMQMPVMDGYTATRKLREAGYARPIVALTAHAMVNDRQKCLDVGCDDYASKPIDRPHLLNIVAAQIAHVRSQTSNS